MNQEYFKDGHLTDKLPWGEPENLIQYDVLYCILQVIKLYREFPELKSLELLSNLRGFQGMDYFTEGCKFIPFPLNKNAECNKTEGMSRDNMISFLAYAKYANYMGRELYYEANFEYKKHVWPLQDIAFYKYCMGKLNGNSLTFKLAKRLWESSCLNIEQHNPDAPEPELDTDGKLLYFIRSWGGMNKDFPEFKKVTGSLVDKLTKYCNNMYGVSPSTREMGIYSKYEYYPDQYLLYPWTWIFEQYFGDMEHPIVSLARELNI